MRTCLFALIGLTCLACETAKTVPDTPLEEAEPVGRYYTVQPGDTLFEIAKRFDLPPEEIAEVNGVDDPRLLAVGQVLFVPEDDPLALPAKAPTPPPVVVEGPPLKYDGRLRWPMRAGVILRDFDAKAEVPFDGIELAAPAGTQVVAAGAGDVLYVGDEGDLGNLVIVRHLETLTTLYAHLDEVRVQVGDKVGGGQVLGTVGRSGVVESPRLHFQVRQGRTPVDPMSRLPDP